MEEWGELLMRVCGPWPNWNVKLPFWVPSPTNVHTHAGAEAVFGFWRSHGKDTERHDDSKGWKGSICVIKATCLTAILVGHPVHCQSPADVKVEDAKSEDAMDEA